MTHRLSASLLAAAACSALLSPAPALGERIQGLVDPGRQVMLSAPLDGIVREIPFEEGAHIQENDVVARFDDGLQQVEVEKARLLAEADAPRKEAEALLAEQEIVVERAEQAQAGSAASDWEVRRARLQRDQALARLEDVKNQQLLAQSELRSQQELLNRHAVRSPFAGRITRRFVEPGTNLQRGEEILSLVSLDPLHARIQLPIELIGRLEIGRIYSLEPDFVISTRRIDARLISLDPVIDSASRTFRCLFEIPNPDEAFPAGFVVFLDTEEIPAAPEAPNLLRSTPSLSEKPQSQQPATQPEGEEPSAAASAAADAPKAAAPSDSTGAPEALEPAAEALTDAAS